MDLFDPRFAAAEDIVLDDKGNVIKVTTCKKAQMQALKMLWERFTGGRDDAPTFEDFASNLSQVMGQMLGSVPAGPPPEFDPPDATAPLARDVDAPNAPDTAEGGTP